MTTAPDTAVRTRRWSDLTGERQEFLRLLLVDTLGLAAAGPANEDAARALHGFAEIAPGEVQVPWTRVRLSPPMGAAALSTLIHAWDFDDTHDEAVVHTASVVVPAALAAAAVRPAPGERVLDGIVTGIQVLARTARLVGAREGVIRTAGLGSLAAAATAATVWNLDSAQLDSALGLALGSVLSPTTREAVVEGSGAKRLQPGLAVAHGVSAAALAGHGVVGPRGWLSGRYGVLPGSDLALADLFTATCELDHVTFKAYPACRYTHAALAAAEDLHARNPDALALGRLVAHVPAGEGYRLVARPWKERGAPLVDAQFSVAWQIAAVWVTGRYDLDTLLHDVGRTDIAEIAQGVDVRQDLAASAVMSGARVDLSTPQGVIDSAESPMPGTGDQRLDRAGVDRKLRTCLAIRPDLGPQSTAARLWRFVDDLSDLDAAATVAALRAVVAP